MAWSTFFGICGAIASLAVVTVGLVHQIWMNYQRKTVEGLAPSLIYTALATYLSWSLYAWTKPDTFLKVTQTPGALIAIVLFVQYKIYGTQNKE